MNIDIIKQDINTNDIEKLRLYCNELLSIIDILIANNNKVQCLYCKQEFDNNTITEKERKLHSIVCIERPEYKTISAISKLLNIDLFEKMKEFI